MQCTHCYVPSPPLVRPRLLWQLSQATVQQHADAARRRKLHKLPILRKLPHLLLNDAKAAEANQPYQHMLYNPCIVFPTCVDFHSLHTWK